MHEGLEEPTEEGVRGGDGLLERRVVHCESTG
jgi:hypothetical protein